MKKKLGHGHEGEYHATTEAAIGVTQTQVKETQRQPATAKTGKRGVGAAQ